MPRPRAPTTIVDANDVLDLDIIALENWTLMTLLGALAENLNCLQWCERRRLIKNSVACEQCNNAASFTTCERIQDKFRWKCSRCSWARSVRHGSFFSGSNIGIVKLVQLMYLWSTDFPLHATTSEIGISERVAIDWFNFCRDLCVDWCRDNSEPIGGMNENDACCAL